MARTPFDLSFEDLVEAGVAATKDARNAAKRRGVPIAEISVAPPATPPRSRGMGWTDERVQLLRKLWQDGLSASQIARQLGGVTRNEVIGKVHRLALTGRVRATTAKRKTLRAPGNADAAATRSSSKTAKAAPPVTAPIAEAPGTATVLTLGAHMCKWPIGDPALDNFTFCGRRSEENGPYCREHQEEADLTQPAKTSGKKRRLPAPTLLRRL